MPPITEEAARGIINLMNSKLRVIVLQVLVWVTVIACLFEAWSKGWISLLLILVAAVTLPLFIVLEYLALFSKRNSYRRSITLVQVLLAIAVLAYFAGAIGYLDDPNNAIVLGIWWAPATSPLVHALDTISTIGIYSAGGTAVLLVGLLVATRAHRPIG